MFKAELAAVRAKDKAAEKKSYGKFKGVYILRNLYLIALFSDISSAHVGFLGNKPGTIAPDNDPAPSSSSSSEPKISEVTD